jgi:diguanylate cyclase (GGDEF)-like protein
MRSFLLVIQHFLSKQSRKNLVMIALGVIAFLGWLDYWSGDEITLSFFYLLPVFAVTWYVDVRSGYVLTVISITTWVISNWFAGETYTYELIRYWNALVRLIFFSLNVFLLGTLKRALINEQMLSRTDSLTGAYNRRAFYHLAEMEILRSRRFNRPFSVAYFDVDNFKETNDHLGHHAGDSLLCDFTNIINASTRETDLLARLGGDEFVILLPETDETGARKVINKLQLALSERWASDHSPQTVSIGVISFNSVPNTVDEILLQTDRAMYEAKVLGKNQAVFRSH